ncbi:PREDICTED: DNA repair protein RAD51 homolog 4-like [Rhagoletis zephyria]|uniref:DNA repair protein RAD51 homolog 4-like n=1 Tax=Rhagoletis zephyria TaxID=28612 RepID=UPI000811A318|nr:PREDICTED: DNA repair protein RAD51 homolog 4-like [Rhagoletis zephyria]
MADLGQFDGLGLSTYLLKKLQRRCITSRYELLITTNAELMKITGLSEIALLEIKQKLGEDYFPRQQCILFKKKTTAKVYKTGIGNFDILTAKIPLQTGSIWEICGKSSAGKTQLCHTIALNFVAQSHGTVLYIDTKGDFSGTRVMEMLRTRNVPNKDCGRIMQEILVERTSSAEGTCDILEKLLTQLTAGTNSDLSNLKLVVIDALPAVFFTHRTERDHLRGKYLLTTLNNLVYKLSKEHHIAFIYVNLLVNIEEETLAAEDEEYEEHIEEVTASPSHGSGKGIRPALGEYWSRAPRLRLSIGIPPDSSAMTNERTLRIIKSCYTAAGGMCSLRITSAGVL